MGAGVVHEDDAVWIDLREEAFDLLLADGHVGVGEEEVNGAVDLHLERGLVAELDPWAEGRGFETLFGAGVDDGVELAGDDFAEGAALEALCHPLRRDAEE